MAWNQITTKQWKAPAPSIIFCVDNHYGKGGRIFSIMAQSFRIASQWVSLLEFLRNANIIFWEVSRGEFASLAMIHSYS